MISDCVVSGLSTEFAPRMIPQSSRRKLVFADNLSGQTLLSFANSLKAKCNADVHNYIAGQTDELAAIDAGFGALIKRHYDDVLDEWLFASSNNLEEWTSSRIPASRREGSRILL